MTLLERKRSESVFCWVCNVACVRQVTEPYFPFRASAIEEFTIGSERCDAAARRYCNGPLKPNTKYYVKLRAYTAPDKYTDTQYTIVRTGQYLPPYHSYLLPPTS